MPKPKQFLKGPDAVVLDVGDLFSNAFADDKVRNAASELLRLISVNDNAILAAMKENHNVVENDGVLFTLELGDALKIKYFSKKEDL